MSATRYGHVIEPVAGIRTVIFVGIGYEKVPPTNEIVIPDSIQRVVERVKATGLVSDPSVTLLLRPEIYDDNDDDAPPYTVRLREQGTLDFLWDEDKDKSFLKVTLPSNHVYIHSVLKQPSNAYTLGSFERSLKRSFMFRRIKPVNGWGFMRYLDVMMARSKKWSDAEILTLDALISEGHKVTKLSRYLQMGVPVNQLKDFIDLPESWVERTFTEEVTPWAL